MDVYTDSQVLISSWRRQGAKSRDLIVASKRIFGIISSCNIHLNLFYIPSAANPVEPPSCVLSLQDSKLSPSAWGQVQARFGGQSGHSAAFMALPSNSGGLFYNHIRRSNSLQRVPSERFFPTLLKDFFRVGLSLGICGRFVLVPFRIFMNKIY